MVWATSGRQFLLPHVRWCLGDSRGLYRVGLPSLGALEESTSKCDFPTAKAARLNAECPELLLYSLWPATGRPNQVSE